MTESPATRKIFGDLEAQKISFETVKVNTRGEIKEHIQCQAWQFHEQIESGVELVMVEIPAGRFMMGSPAYGAFPDEKPYHSIGVGPYFMGKFTVTQLQWQSVMGKLPPCRCPGENRPVDRVSWFDACDFCRKLSQMTGRTYHLPSEAQWEYACRAGTSTPFFFGKTITTDLANYVGDHIFLDEPKGEYRHIASEAGSLPPNAFGIHEMHGNVWEWCADAWHDDYNGAPMDGSAWNNKSAPHRVLRGGCWHDPPQLCRSATRLKQIPSEREDFFGFRVVMEIPLDNNREILNNMGNHQPVKSHSPRLVNIFSNWLDRIRNR